MNKIYLLLAIVLFATISFAQDAKKDDWIRIQSDDGEFSIEVPAKYGYFHNPNGTSVSDGSGSYVMRDMSVFNSYAEHTLLSFESYVASNKALKAIQHSDENQIKGEKLTSNSVDIKKDNYKIRQIISKNDKQYTVRQYFFSKKNIYVLVASSRLGETAVMRRFLESMKFKPEATEKILSKDTRFSNLKETSIEFLENYKEPKEVDKPQTPSKSTESDSTVKPMIFLSIPRAGYTNTARDASINGTVRLKVTFSELGQVTKIIVVKKPDKSLAINSAITLLRMKFIPEEKDDKPVSTTKTIEYSFSIG